MREQRIASMIVFLALIALLNAGCATRDYQTFPRSAAVSDRVHETFAAQSTALEASEGLPADEYEKRRRYQVQMLKMLHEFESKRMVLLADEFTDQEARQLDEAMVIAYRMIETLVAFPGRLQDDGTPADPETASALENRPALPGA